MFFAEIDGVNNEIIINMHGDKISFVVSEIAELGWRLIVKNG